MKKLLFAVCALAAISLLAPDAGFAQWENHIGIYTSADAANHCIATTPATQTSIYFVISNPRLGDGTPVAAVNAFELRVLVEGPAGSMFRLAETLPVGAINVGVSTDPYDSMYIAGWPGTTPVVGGFCSVMTWNVLFLAPGPWYFRLSPTTNPGVAGKMAINVPVGEENFLVGLMPSSDDFANPVFSAGDCVVSTETSSFGNVKALFR
ncbi:MAG: hypothetical protein IPK64_07180 [bacterium]|nr:hypothetical protein [bacterium]